MSDPAQTVTLETKTEPLLPSPSEREELASIIHDHRIYSDTGERCAQEVREAIRAALTKFIAHAQSFAEMGGEYAPYADAVVEDVTAFMKREYPALSAGETPK